MASENLQNLLIRIEADTSRLRSQMAKAEKALQNSSGKMAKSTKRFDASLRTARASAMKLRLGLLAVVGAATAAVAGMTKIVTSGTNAAQSLARTADRVGFTVEQLQELRYAAEQSGVGAKTLDMALQRFSRRVGEANQGTGELIGVLQQYQIATKNADGTARNNIDVLNDLANAIKGAKSEQEALRIAFKAFDSEGAALVVALRNGKDGLDLLRQAARDAGIVMDEAMIRKAEKAGNQLDALWYTIKAKLVAIMVELAPKLQKVAFALADVAKEALDAVEKFLKFIGAIEKSAAEKKIESLTQKLRELQSATVEMYLASQLASNYTVGVAQLQDYLKMLQKIRDEIGGIRTGQSLDPFGGKGDPVGTGTNLPGIVPKKTTSSSSKATDADSAITRLAERVTLLKQQAAAVNLVGRELALYNAQTEAANILAKAWSTATAAQQPQLKALADEYVAATMKLYDLQEAQRQAEIATQELSATFDNVANTFENTFIDALTAGKDRMEKFRQAAKQLVSDLLRQFLRLAVINPIFNSLFGGMTGFSPRPSMGGILGGLFGGMRAEGGPVNRGKAYVVGEKGPELFMPKADGMIAPNSSLQKKSQAGPQFFVDMRGASMDAVKRLETFVAQINGSIEQRAIAAVTDRRARVLG